MKCYYCKIWDGNCTHPVCERNSFCCFHCDLRATCFFFTELEKDVLSEQGIIK